MNLFHCRHILPFPITTQNEQNYRLQKNNCFYGICAEACCMNHCLNGEIKKEMTFLRLTDNFFSLFLK